VARRRRQAVDDARIHDTRAAAGATNGDAVPGDGIQVEFLDDQPDD